MNTPKTTNGKNKFPFWATVWAFLKPHKRRMTVATICSLFVGIAVALQPITLKWIIDEGFMRKMNETQLAPAELRFKYALAFIGLYTFLSFFRIGIWLIGYRQLIFALETLFSELRSRFFRHVQSLCFRFHDQISSGELYSYIMGAPINSMKTFLQQFSMHIPYQIVTFFVAVTALAIFNWVMTLITVAMIGIIVFVNYRSRLVIREVSAKFMRTESSVSKFIADMLRATRAIKIHAMEENVNFSFEFHIDRIRKRGLLQSLRSQFEGIKAEIVQYVGMALVYATGAYFCIYRNMELGSFVAFITSTNLLMGPIMSMMQINLIRGNAEAGMERIMRVMDVEKTTKELPVEEQVEFASQQAQAEKRHEPCIELKNVYFSYEENTQVIKDMSCRIYPGESVALVGPSGSGKSTFIALLQRLYDVEAGEVILNGVNVKHFSLNELRSAFGVVSQAPFIFQDSIKNNIRVTKPEADEGEIRAAIELAYADEFIDKLPNGIATQVGESGHNLSGGQKQRLAIARALLPNPEYFIFDEATSALDNESERKIQQAIETVMKGHTTIIIAHRLTTIRNVDRILVFEDGKIVQDGTYEQLAEHEGVFKNLLTHGESVDSEKAV